MKSRIIIIFYILIATKISSSAQESPNSELTKAEKIRWHIFENEVGFNVGNLGFSEGKYGFSLIYKRRYEPGQFVRVQQTRALRFLLNFNLYNWSNIKPKDTLSYTIPLTQNKIGARNQKNESSYSLTVGYEFQQNMGRFQFYYGPDIELGYARSNDRIEHYDFYYLPVFDSNGNLINSSNPFGYIDNKILSGSVYFFGGVKYFINPRLSVTLESCIGLSYSRLHAKSNNTGVIYENRDNSFNGLTQSKRILSVNFHF